MNKQNKSLFIRPLEALIDERKSKNFFDFGK